MLRFRRPLLAAGLTASLLATAATISFTPPALAQMPPQAMPPQNMPPQGMPPGPPPSPTADNTTMDINVFYEQLGKYGSWIQHPDYQYVFIPADVGAGWRPYQEGRWVWTDDYGWYWESYEPFGWATYHYGRWGYDPAYGWFWVPGDVWSPAWVTWRRGEGKTGWAPVAPDRPGLAVGRPAYYAPPVAESWVFVEDRYMGEPDIALYVAPIVEITAFLAGAPDYYEPIWNDGYYVNRGFNVTVYDAPIRDRIVARDVIYVDRSDDLFYDEGRLGIFAPRLAFGRVPPPRLERDIDPGRRAMVRQYVRDTRDLPGVVAPSAALLGAIEPDQRRELRQRLRNDPNAYRRELGDLERQRAGRVNELRQEADSRRDALEQQRRQQLDQRQQQVERLRAEQRARAERVTARPDAQTGPRPGLQRPGRSDSQPGAAPNLPPGVPAGGQAARPDGPRSPVGAGTMDPARQEMERRRAEQQRQQGDQQRQQVEQRRQQADQQRQQNDQRRQQVEQQRQQVEQQRARQQQERATQQQQRAAQQQQQQEQRARQQQERSAQQQQQRAAQQQQRARQQQEGAARQQQQRAAQQQQRAAEQQQRAAQQQQQRAAQQQQRAAQQQQRAAQQQQRAAQQQQQRPQGGGQRRPPPQDQQQGGPPNQRQ